MITLSNLIQKHCPIGLDVGTSGIRAVQIETSAEQFILSKMMDMERAPQDQFDNDTLPERIQNCLQLGEFAGRNIITTPFESNVEYFTLELPETLFSQSSENVEKAIRWEVGRLCNDPIDNITTAYWKLPPSTMLHHNTIGIAIQSDAVIRTLDHCSSIGLQCSCVDTSTTALCRLGSVLNDWPMDSIWGILDIGYHQSHLIICVNRTPVLVRKAGMGSHTWTQRIAESLAVGENTAEIHKKEHGLTLSASAKTNNVESELGLMLMGLLKSDLNELAAEIKRSYEYILSCYPNYRASDLIMVGNGSKLNQLPEFLSSALGITAKRASSYLNQHGCRLQMPEGQESLLDALGKATGLAMGNG